MTKERLRQYKYLKRELAAIEQDKKTGTGQEIDTLRREITEIETYVNTIPQSNIRQLLHYRYMQGMPWKMLSRKLYGHVNEDRARMAVNRYMKRNKVNDNCS